MKDYKKLPREQRIAVKKGVKQFLTIEIGTENLASCIIPSDANNDYTTFGIPLALVGRFKEWAVRELRRCFPDMHVVEPWEV
jgi:hypothetical protein